MSDTINQMDQWNAELFDKLTEELTYNSDERSNLLPMDRLYLRAARRAATLGAASCRLEEGSPARAEGIRVSAECLTALATSDPSAATADAIYATARNCAERLGLASG